MPRKANKPPPEDWEDQKSTIISYVSQYPWSAVIEKMKEDHQFVASPEQFDAQMRAWGLRKNLKEQEWRGVFRVFDRLATRHQKKIRMRILGSIVPEDRIQRSRVRYYRSDTDVSGTVPSHVSFEVLGTEGNWSPCTTNDENENATRLLTSDPAVELLSPVVQLIPPGSLHSETASTSQLLRELVPASINEFISQPRLDYTPRGLEFSTIDSAHDFEGNVDQQTTYTTWSPSMHPLGMPLDILSSHSPSMYSPSRQDPFYHWILLGSLPFKRFEIDLKNHGVDLANFGSQTMTTQRYRISRCVAPFLRDVAEVASVVPNITKPKRSVQDFRSTTLLRAFQSLLPGEVSQEQRGNDSDLIAEDATLETNFIRLLLFSIVNGFAGLGDISIASILKFLSRYGNTSALFVQVLKANPSYVAKSLAENLFKAAIEAQESSVVKYVLETQLVQVNDIVCVSQGELLTAVERAAQLRNHKVMKILLNAHADVNKTIASTTPFKDWTLHLFLPRDGALWRLIDTIQMGETLSSDVMSMIQALLQAGARVDVQTLGQVIMHKRDSELTFILLSAILRTQNTDLISDDMLSFVTGELEEEQSDKSVELILQACEWLHEGRCLRDDVSQVEMALVHSARRGHLQVVQRLLPYSNDLSRVLSASLRSGNREIIDLVLARRPSFHGPVHSLQSDRRTGDQTTPLAEAIRIQADDLIHLCEEAGALDHLNLDGHFGAALAAAATTGNLQYIRKLFQHRPWPHPEETYDALVCSIENGYDDISLMLLGAGAAVNRKGSNLSPLCAAISRHNARLVRAILEYDVVEEQWGHYIRELIKWGDHSIILDLHLAFPNQKIAIFDTYNNNLHGPPNSYPGPSLDDDLLNFLLDLDLVSTRALTDLLKVPIMNDNTASVIRLIKLGADPSDSYNLYLAACYQPIILQILLDNIPKPARQVNSGFGTRAIMATINAGFAGLQALEILLASKIIDFRSFSDDGPKFPSNTPLGLAIERAEELQGAFPVVSCLIDGGCDPSSVVVVVTHRASSVFVPNQTALLAAIQTRKIGLVRLLLDRGAEINAQTIRRLTRTPLQRAAELGCLETVQLLLTRGADVNALPAQRGGGTALQFAAISGNCNIAVELLDHGANPFALPSTLYGRWPIEGAAEHGRLDMIEFLLKAMICNSEQLKRAIDLAQEGGHLGCKDLLLDSVDMVKGYDSDRLSTPS